MKLQSKFTILVVTIITIPILMAMIVAYFQFFYLQKNQMLFNKSYIMEWVHKKMYPFQNSKPTGKKGGATASGARYSPVYGKLYHFRLEFCRFQSGQHAE